MNRQRPLETVSKERVIIFFKTPVIGRVKTRIAAERGDLFARDLYSAMLRDLSRNLKPLLDRLVWYCDTVQQADGNSFLKTCSRQRGRGLGSKMYNAFKDEFRRGCERAVLIGSDIPYIDHQILIDCLNKLHTFDAVIGASEDGGYYLIGFKKSSLKKTVFENIPWSTDTVYENTVEKLKAHALSVYEAPVLHDIDTVEDLAYVLRTQNNDRVTEIKMVFDNYRRMEHGTV